MKARGEEIPVEQRELYLHREFGGAADRYHLKSWSGHLVLFRAEDADPMFDSLSRTYGWELVATKGVQLRIVPGNHDTLVLGQSAVAMAAMLRREVAEWIRSLPAQPSAREMERTEK